jgi:heat shock protein 5
MARGNTRLFGSLSMLFYLVLLFSPLALLKTAHAQSEQKPLQENYGVGMFYHICQTKDTC